MACTYIPQLDIIIVATYRSPLGNFEMYIEKLDSAMNHIIQSFKLTTKILIAGDFNVKFNEGNRTCKQLLNIMRNYGLSPAVNSPTRIWRSTANCLDNIFTNLAEYSTHLNDYVISDHIPQIITTHFPKIQEHQYRRIYSEQNMAKFRTLIADQPWEDHLNINDPNKAFSILISIFRQALEIAFPLKRINNSSVHAPFSKNLQAIKDQLKWLQRVRGSWGNTEEIDTLIQNQKQYYNSEAQRESKNKYIEKIKASDNKSKTIWDSINTVTDRKQRPTNINTTPTAEQFNTFFTPQITNTAQTATPVTGTVKQRSITEYRITTLDEILTAINNLKNKNSTDIYEINVPMVKCTADIIAPFLAKVCNILLETGTFPDVLKHAKVHPILKKGDPTQPQSYRPIALLPIFSKIIETILLKRVDEYISENDILTQCQHGFRAGRSTDTALQSYMTKICTAIDGKLACCSCLCDLSKAFDSISHTILKKKLQNYGFEDKALSILSSYLGNRVQSVYFNGKLSSPRPILAGVAQGSLMGPMMFNIYINDLPDYLECDTLLYADDTTLLLSHKDPLVAREQLDSQLEIAEEWFTVNELQVNNAKNQRLEMVMDRWTQPGETVKLLGLHIDPRLNWKAHIDSLCSKLAKAAYAIKRMHQAAGSDAAITTYYALFHTKLAYGIEIWGLSPHMRLVVSEQKRAIRSIRGVPAQEHCKPIFKSLGILTAPAEYALRVLSNIHKYRRNEIERSGDIHYYNTRYRDYLRPPGIRLHSAEYLRRGIALYNSCPYSWKQETSGVFIKNVKRALLDQTPYSIKEIVFS